MKNRIATLSLTVLFTAASISFAQKPTPAAVNPNPASTTMSPPAAATTSSTSTALSAQPSAADMQKMMEQMTELGKPGENHKLLGEMAGTWSYAVKMWMDPTGKPQESKGTSTRKAIMDGRFYLAEHSGKFQMPGKDGKMTDMNFQGMAIEGYDNVKKKFVSSWIDNMGTMILMSEGNYDAASKTFTYTANCEMMPGVQVKIRETLKIVDANHHNFEWYEDRGQGEAKTMEISYTRKK
jgi:hypothetical protein